MSDFLANATVDPAVFALRPDYRAVLITARNIEQIEDSAAVEQLLRDAENAAAKLLESTSVTELPHIAQWREAYKAFGAKPSEFKCSSEALLRRTPNGLPRINPLTDLYNALSVKYQVPIGGENLDAYQGPAQLVLAVGNESFDTVASGEQVIENPKPGEVIWRDDLGVTCRRWNYRQCQRTQLKPETSNAFFIIDALSAIDDQALEQLTEELSFWLGNFGATVEHRVIRG